MRQSLELLANGEAELGIIRFRVEYREYFEEQTRQRELCFRILGKFRYQLLMASRHPLAAKQNILRADLAGFPEIVHGDTFRVHSMLVTALNPYIGYENAAKTAKKAFKENISLKEACVSLGFLSAENFDEVFHPEQMV